MILDLTTGQEEEEIPLGEIPVVEMAVDHLYTTRFVMSVAKTARCRLGRVVINRFIAVIVLNKKAVEIVGEMGEGQEEEEIQEDSHLDQLVTLIWAS